MGEDRGILEGALEGPKFRLALEGGGARIFAHIAALEAVRDCNLPVSVVSGVSAGAIAAVLFSAGITLNDIKQVLENGRHEELRAALSGTKLSSDYSIAYKIWRSKPFLPHKLLSGLLSDLIRDKHKANVFRFSELKYPTLITAANLQTCKDRVFGRKDTLNDDVVMPMLASANIPFVFYGRQAIGWSDMVDGGLFCNIPIDELQLYAEEELPETAEDPIIAFVFPEEERPSEPATLRGYLFSLINTTLSAPTRRLERTNHHRSKSIHMIAVPCSRVGTFDFGKAWNILTKGTEAEEFQLVYETVKRELLSIYDSEKRKSTPQHKEVRLAIETCDRVSELAPRRSRKNATRHYTCIHVPYTHLDEISDLQDRLLERSKTLFSPDLKHVDFTIGADEDTGRRFDAFKRPEIAVSNEAIYSFPFFLTPFRRSSWGVIPYGTHRAVGVVVSKTLPKRGELMRLATNDLSELKHSGGSNDWLGILFDIFNKVDADENPISSVYSIDGYMHGEIVPLLIHQLNNQSLEDRFLRFGKHIEGAVKTANIDGKDKYEFKFSAEVMKEVRSGTSAIIFDLADKKLMENAVGSDCHILNFAHELRFPVGIGFSLPIARDMDVLMRWKSFATIAFETLKAPKTQQCLLESGIELLDDRYFVTQSTVT
jgi:predicted acylesterase/phospholipase RssA